MNKFKPCVTWRVKCLQNRLRQELTGCARGQLLAGGIHIMPAKITRVINVPMYSIHTGCNCIA
nr:MAG TPA: hypothetical protein [Caudoviricetes sp.]